MTMNVRIIISFILCLFILPDLRAVETEIQQADSAYMAKDYLKAIEIYSQIEKNEGISPALLYNLGNAYLNASDYGRAMLCYERAYRLDPSDAQIRQNLLYLKSKIEDSNRAEQKGRRVSVQEDEPTFFQSVHKAIAVEIYSDRWAVWGVVSFFLFLTCAGVYMFTKKVVLRKIGFFGGFILIGITVICIIFGCIGASEFKSAEHGVIIAYKTVLKNEPTETVSDTQNEGNVLTRGTKVRVISEETDASGNILWYKIRLNSDYIGWVSADDIELI